MITVRCQLPIYAIGLQAATHMQQWNPLPIVQDSIVIFLLSQGVVGFLCMALSAGSGIHAAVAFPKHLLLLQTPGREPHSRPAQQSLPCGHSAPLHHWSSQWGASSRLHRQHRRLHRSCTSNCNRCAIHLASSSFVNRQNVLPVSRSFVLVVDGQSCYWRAPSQLHRQHCRLHRGNCNRSETHLWQAVICSVPCRQPGTILCFSSNQRPNGVVFSFSFLFFCNVLFVIMCHLPAVPGKVQNVSVPNWHGSSFLSYSAGSARAALATATPVASQQRVCYGSACKYHHDCIAAPLSRQSMVSPWHLKLQGSTCPI